MGMMPLLWCCDGSGERKTTSSGTDTVAATSAAPTPTSERIATMTEEVRMLMEQFGENPDQRQHRAARHHTAGTLQHRSHARATARYERQHA